MAGGNADGVEIDVGHGGEHRLFVEQRLALETPFPEMARDLIFGVGLAGDAFVQHAHEPGQVAQAGTVLFGPLVDRELCRHVQFLDLARQQALHGQRAVEELGPAAQHLIPAPTLGALSIDADNEVVVVAHHRVGSHIDGEHTGQLLDALDDPAAAMLVVVA